MPRLNLPTLSNGRKAAIGAATGVLLVATAGGAAMASAHAPAAAQTQAASSDGRPAGGAAKATTSVTTITESGALKAAQAALKAAEDDGKKITVAVVDRSGKVRVLLAGDGAGPQTEDSAKRKAFTAVSFGKATSQLVQGASGTAPSLRDIGGTLFLPGGVPVAADNAPIAGIGVGGAPSGDLDEKYAAAGLAAISGDLH